MNIVFVIIFKEFPRRVEKKNPNIIRDSKPSRLKWCVRESFGWRSKAREKQCEKQNKFLINMKKKHEQ